MACIGSSVPSASTFLGTSVWACISNGLLLVATRVAPSASSSICFTSRQRFSPIVDPTSFGTRSNSSSIPMDSVTVKTIVVLPCQRRRLTSDVRLVVRDRKLVASSTIREKSADGPSSQRIDGGMTGFADASSTERKRSRRTARTCRAATQVPILSPRRLPSTGPPYLVQLIA